jgi:hypothetical protein
VRVALLQLHRLARKKPERRLLPPTGQGRIPPRRHSEHVRERAREMALIVEAAGERDLGEGQLLLLQQRRRMFDTKVSDVFADGQPVDTSKCLREM